LKPSANTSPTNANTTTRKPFKRNIGHSSNATMLCSMNDTCGIDHQGVALRYLSAGALLQGVALRYLKTGASPLWSANGAAHASPGQRPGVGSDQTSKALKGRSKPCRSARTDRPGFQPSISLQFVTTQGVALGYLRTGALPLKKGGLL